MKRAVKKALLNQKKNNSKAKKAFRIQPSVTSLRSHNAAEVILPSEDESFIPEAHSAHSVNLVQHFMESSIPVFTKLVSPEVQRSATSGKLVIVTKEEQAERRKKAEKLGLKWYV